MSIALKPGPRKVRPSVGPDSYAGHLPPDDGTVETAPTPAAPTPPAEPTLQDSIAAPTAPAAPTALAAPQAAPGIDGTVETLLGRLQSVILTQQAAYVASYASRGAIVNEIINTKLSAARNRQQRDDYRADAMRAAELASLSVVDRKSESKPNPDRWNLIYWLVTLEPNAVNLASMSTAEKVATLMIERVKTPNAFNDPETFAVRPGFADRFSAIIGKAVEGKLAANQIGQLIDDMEGIPAEAPKAAIKKDWVKTAESSAKTITDRFRSQEIEPATFFDVLVPWLNKYGWTHERSQAAPKAAPKAEA